MKLNKKHRLFSIIGVFVLFLNSCQKDELAQESKNIDYNFRTITLNQVKDRSSKVSTLFAKTINQASKSNKITSAIEIDSSSVIYLERANGFKSFTYRLKDDLTKNYFNNIVIYEFPDGSTKAFSIKYILNKSLLEATQQNNLKLSITGYETSVYNTQNANNRGSGYSCVSIGYWTTVFKCDGQVYGNQKPWCFNSDGSPATKEVFITIDEDCSYSSGVGDGAESGGIYVGGTPTNFEQGGGDSTSIGGIFIPNPYEFGEEDLNNPDFMFSSQVSQYLNTIPSWNDLIYQANNYGTITTFWMQPFFVDYLKNNGELTTENKVLVKSVIDRFSQIYNNQNAYKMYENSQEKNLINYRLFQTFLKYPTISAQIVQEVFIYRDQNLWTQESVEFTEQLMDNIITAKNNNTLLTAIPFFKYPLNSNYQTLYPNFSNLLIDYLPYMATPEMLSIIHDITGVSTSQIANDLKWGSGAEIQIKQLGVHPIHGEIKGRFDPENPNIIEIDVDLVNLYETSFNPSDEATPLQSLILFSVLLHELVHYQDYQFDNIMTNNIELGLYFEQLYLGGSYEFNPNGDGSIIFIKP
ncbi:MAG: hypothetical protein V4670_00945 [Bacteroidota bacterium]